MFMGSQRVRHDSATEQQQKLIVALPMQPEGDGSLLGALSSLMESG